MTPPAFARLLMLLSLCLAIWGCAPVAPWERGHLAKPQMSLDPHPAQTGFREHIYGGREAASGGASTSGGGCGCY
jgi:hypothetical protein